MEQIAVNMNSQLNALLSDDVVMQWLMDLESDFASADAVDHDSSELEYHA
jgi:hypothetical protein